MGEKFNHRQQMGQHGAGTQGRAVPQPAQAAMGMHRVDRQGMEEVGRTSRR